MTANKSKALSIQVNLNGLSFCILNTQTNGVDYLQHLAFEQKLTPFDTLNRLKAHLSTDTAFSDGFSNVQLIHQNELATFVPKALYNEAHKADYLKFNAKILKTDVLAEDTIEANQSVNVYVPYVNINNYIFENFGAFEFKHAATILLQKALQYAQDFEDETLVFINVNTHTFELFVIENKALKLYNTFEYNTKEDFIYYILFVFEQLQLNPETAQIQLSGSITEGDDLYQILYTYVRHVDFIKPTYNFILPETLQENVTQQHYLILSSL